MGLIIERLPRDPWELEATRRLHARRYAGIEYYRAEHPETLEPWELQHACELSLVVEQMIRWWESMEATNAGRPKLKGLDRALMRESRRVRYQRIWGGFSYAIETTKRPVVFAASNPVALRNHIDLLRVPARLLEPLEAFDAAYSAGGVWWVF